MCKRIIVIFIIAAILFSGCATGKNVDEIKTSAQTSSIETSIPSKATNSYTVPKTTEEISPSRIQAETSPSNTPTPKSNDKFKFSKNTIIINNGIKISDLQDYFHYKFKELVQKLGDDYEIKGTGPEESYDGYYYSRLGITLVFDDYNYDIANAPLIWVECDDDKLALNGVKQNMNFQQIQKLLGKGSLKKTKNDNNKDMFYYDLIYNVENITLDFCSNSKDAANGFSLDIYNK